MSHDNVGDRNVQLILVDIKSHNMVEVVKMVVETGQVDPWDIGHHHINFQLNQSILWEARALKLTVGSAPCSWRGTSWTRWSCWRSTTVFPLKICWLPTLFIIMVMVKILLLHCLLLSLNQKCLYLRLFTGWLLAEAIFSDREWPTVLLDIFFTY